MFLSRKNSILFGMLMLSVSVQAITVPMHLLAQDGSVRQIGSIDIQPSPYGLIFTPTLMGLSPGLHGFHVHTNPQCGLSTINDKQVVGGAAGGHYDPMQTNRHEGPWGNGHLGDLPSLYVDAKGEANQPVLAPRLRIENIVGRSLMVHAGGDNHSDHPAILGGGGARVACGVI